LFNYTWLYEPRGKKAIKGFKMGVTKILREERDYRGIYGVYRPFIECPLQDR
jgi:hypothetical protein